MNLTWMAGGRSSVSPAHSRSYSCHPHWSKGAATAEQKVQSLTRGLFDGEMHVTTDDRCPFHAAVGPFSRVMGDGIIAWLEGMTVTVSLQGGKETGLESCAQLSKQGPRALDLSQLWCFLGNLGGLGQLPSSDSRGSRKERSDSAESHKYSSAGNILLCKGKTSFWMPGATVVLCKAGLVLGRAQ